jgi:hypothetical protein
MVKVIDSEVLRATMLRFSGRVGLALRLHPEVLSWHNRESLTSCFESGDWAVSEVEQLIQTDRIGSVEALREALSKPDRELTSMTTRWLDLLHQKRSDLGTFIALLR